MGYKLREVEAERANSASDGSYSEKPYFLEALGGTT